MAAIGKPIILTAVEVAKLREYAGRCRRISAGISGFGDACEVLGLSAASEGLHEYKIQLAHTAGKIDDLLSRAEAADV